MTNGAWAVAFAALAVAQQVAETVPPTPQSPEELKVRIAEVLADTGTPGAAVALIVDGELAWSDGIGWADAERRIPAGADTLFRAGSISKSIVGLSVLMLQEEGLLDLEAPVAELAPEVVFRNPFRGIEPVRLVHLLEHTSGFNDIHLSEYASNDPAPLELAGALGRFSKSRFCRWPPGRHMSYCNSGPAVAAFIVAKKAGMPFERFVSERLFEPLGIETATFRQPPEAEGLLAKGYSRDGRTELPYWHIAFRPAGALNISANDLAKVVTLLINRGAYQEVRLLSSESIDRMEFPRTTLAARNGLLPGYGLGNYAIVDQGFLFHGHAGGVNAFLAEYAYLPSHRLGYVCMINSTNGEAFDRILDLLRPFLVRDLEQPLPPEPFAVPRSRLRALAGYYRPLTPRQEITRAITRLIGVVWVHDEAAGLRFEPLFGEPTDLLAVTDRRFRQEDEPLPTSIFIETEDGLVLQRATASGGNYRAASLAMVWFERGMAVLCLALMFSSLVSALGWAVRKVFGRLRDGESPSLRLIPLAAVLCFAASACIWIVGADDIVMRMGNRTLWSISFWLLNWLFALLALLGLLYALRNPRRKAATRVRIHSLAVSAANVTVALYFLYWGIIGWRPWA